MHIVVCSALFDRKAEGICTGRLVRALLAAGARISLVTSNRADTTYSHPNLRTLVFPVQPREPSRFFQIWAQATNSLACNMYVWSRRAGRAQLNDGADLVYARAWPDSSLMAGYRLAEALGLPLWIHFSDPMPPPGDQPLSAARRRDLQRVADRAQVCTFTNAKTIEYQRQQLRFPHPDWGEVVPHVAPEPAYIGPRPQTHRFLYVGTFNRKRDPLIMLQAFRLYLARHPRAVLKFLGPGGDMLKRRVAELSLQANVEYEGYHVDPPSQMAQADVMIGLDNLGEEPMYSLTKTVEYLTVNRPFLHIVRPESPDYQLIARFPQTARTITPDSAEAITEAMLACMQMPEDPALYAPRFDAMRAYSGEAIAGKLLARMRACLQPANPTS
jgi:glycosyltransferase involved in cell wall biosynthesis